MIPMRLMTGLLSESGEEVSDLVMITERMEHITARTRKCTGGRKQPRIEEDIV
jgi:hypothetical protein